MFQAGQEQSSISLMQGPRLSYQGSDELGMRVQVQAEVGVRTCPIAEMEAQL